MCLVAALIMSLYGKQERKLTKGELVAIILYITKAFQPFSQLGQVYRALVMNMVDVENLYRLFQETSDVKDNSTVQCVKSHFQKMQKSSKLDLKVFTLNFVMSVLHTSMNVLLRK